MDRSWIDRIKSKLSTLHPEIEFWDPALLVQTKGMTSDLDWAIERASVAVVLLSPEYVDSPTARIELSRLFAQRPGLRLFPIVLGECSWQDISELRQTRIWVTPSPLKFLSKVDLDKELEKIAKFITDLIEKPESQPTWDDLPTEPFHFSQSTQAVLAQARQLSSSSRRARVTSSCLLFGIAGIAGSRDDTARFLRDTFERTKRYEPCLNEFLSDGDRVGEGSREAGALLGKVSPNVWNVLQRATKISSRAHSKSEIHVRTLLAALLTDEQGITPQTVAVRLEKLGIDPKRLKEEFRAFVYKAAPDDNQPEWDAILPPLPKPIPPPSAPVIDAAANGFTRGTPGYTAEFCGVGRSKTVVDHLGMQAAAHRLAELIALRETKLPLAIGLFGNWGSGKSHFMNLIDNHIKMLTDAEKQPHPGVPDKWCREIVPIYFNAWHYVDANLWASLVCQIFDSLFAYLRPKEDALQKVQDLLEKASGATARAAEEVAVAQTATEKARNELTIAQETSRQQQTAITGMLHGLSSLLPNVHPAQLQTYAFELLGIQKEIKTLDDLREIVQESQSLRARFETFWNSVWNPSGRGWRLSWLLATLVIVPTVTLIAVPYVPILKEHLHAIGKTAASLLTTLSGMLLWARPILAQAQRYLKQLETWQKQAEDEQQRLLDTPEVKAAKSNVAVALQKENEAKIKLTEAQAHENQLKDEMRNLAPERRLGRFIETRAQSADYRGQLGLVSLARKDFQELSDLFADTNALKSKVAELKGSDPAAAQDLQELSKSIDRIVLFVDDLDRCQAEKIVDVLQAVHLLLAFPLFAVIVGVDQRALRQSLRLQFKGLLTTSDQDQTNEKAPSNGSNSDDNRPATPLDYLEKVFHVPFHLPPMGDAGFKTLIERLTELPKQTETTTTQNTTPAGQTTGNDHNQSNVQPTAPANTPGGNTLPAQTPASHGSPPAPGGPNPPAQPAVSPPGSPQPTPVVGSVPLHDWERAALQDYHPIISTPRGAKRLLNTYRLVRAGIPESEWNSFKGDANQRGEFRIVMLLLAAAAGYPAAAREWFELLRAGQDFPDLHTLWSSRSDPGWLVFRGMYTKTTVNETPNLDQKLLCKWLDRVELFAF